MKRICVTLAAIALLFVPTLAGEYLSNDTGETVVGLRVVFSEPVVLTAFGDILTVVEPEGESTEFTFSGGELELWHSHWFSWQPSTASLIEYEWIFPERDHPGIHALSREYLHEFHDSFDSPEVTPEWQIDDPTSKTGFDPGVSIELVAGAIHIHGYSVAPSIRQSGIRLAGFRFLGDADFEVAVRIAVEALDACFIIEMNDLASQAALAQFRGRAERLSVIHDQYHGPDIYGERSHTPNPDLLSVTIDGSLAQSGVIVRILYRASEERLSCQVGANSVGWLDLAWLPEQVLLRIFVETNDDLQGDIDLLIEEVHVGTDGELITE